MEQRHEREDSTRIPSEASPATPLQSGERGPFGGYSFQPHTMSKAPAFQYYAKDHIATLAKLSPVEAGTWVVLVSHCWEHGGPLPEALSLRLVTREALESVRFLLTEKDGGLTFDWMEEIRAKQALKSLINSRSGSKGGRGNTRGTKAKSERFSNAKRTQSETKPYRAEVVVEEEEELLSEEVVLKDQSDELALAPKFDPKKKSLFRESAVGDFATFRLLPTMRQAEATGIDVGHYFRALVRWSDNKTTTKRTAQGWVSTVEGAMERDKNEGKLMTTGAKESKDETLLQFLSLGR